MLALSCVSRASEIGMNVNEFHQFTKTDGVVAMDGTGTCRTGGKSDVFKTSEFPSLLNLTLGELRTQIRKSDSIVRRQEIMNFIEKVLIDESPNKN